MLNRLGEEAIQFANCHMFGTVEHIVADKRLIDKNGIMKSSR